MSSRSSREPEKRPGRAHRCSWRRLETAAGGSEIGCSLVCGLCRGAGVVSRGGRLDSGQLCRGQSVLCRTTWRLGRWAGAGSSLWLTGCFCFCATASGKRIASVCHPHSTCLLKILLVSGEEPFLGWCSNGQSWNRQRTLFIQWKRLWNAYFKKLMKAWL